MTYDLRSQPWIPFRRQSGSVEWGPPDLLVDDVATNPVIAIASPRPDFDAALTEFLIGLLAASFRLRDDDQWHELWVNPPTREALRDAITNLPAAFDLDGDGARFFQDYARADLVETELSPIQEILVEGKNDPLFIKPEQFRTLGRPAVAMALITIQSYSPAGGRGYRTSMRGGGPLTTLVDPRPILPSIPMAASLWRYLWANVPTLSQLRDSGSSDAGFEPASIFPWLAPTRTSEGDRATTPNDASALQAFFGMPRRIRVDFADHGGRCDLTGAEDTRVATGFRVKGYGVQYTGWKHPLSPYYQGKQLNEWLPVHAQPGGIGWRDWYPLLHSSSTGKKTPASVVARFNRRAEWAECTRFSIRAFGFDVTNAKVREWVDARLPGFADEDEGRLSVISSFVASLTEATDLIAYSLQRGVTSALYGDGEDPPGDLSFPKRRLWSAMEASFYVSVFRALDAGSAADIAACLPTRRLEFMKDLRAATIEVFDAHVDSDASEPEALRRYVVARLSLVMTLNGSGKQGEKLFQTLGIEMQKPSRSAGKRKRERGEA